jgi:ribosomal protein S18 acetylase RimI-like enzyme
VGAGGESAPSAIRPAQESDATAAIDLWTVAYVDEGEGGRTAPYSEEDFFEATKRGRVFVAEQGGSVVGVVALLAPGAPGRAVARSGEAELSRLVVAATARGQGIGERLVAHCEQLARDAGWPGIVLWSRRYQTAAHGLYEGLGYRRTPERDSVDDSGHERLVFLLDLSATDFDHTGAG